MERFFQILPRFRGVFTLIAHSFSRFPGAFPHADTLACGAQRAVRRRAREGGEESAGRAAMGQGRGLLMPIPWQEDGGRGAAARRGKRAGSAAKPRGAGERGTSGRGKGRRRGSEAARAVGRRIARRVARVGLQRARGLPTFAAVERKRPWRALLPPPRKHPCPPPRAGRRDGEGHGGRTINPTTRSYASRKTLRRAEGEE